MYVRAAHNNKKKKKKHVGKTENLIKNPCLISTFISKINF